MATPHLYSLELLQPFDSEGTWLSNRHSRHSDPVVHEARVSAEFGAGKGSHEPQKTMKNNEALMALSHLKMKGIDVLDIAAAPLLRIRPRAPSSQLGDLSGCWPAKNEGAKNSAASAAAVHTQHSRETFFGLQIRLDCHSDIKCSREHLYLNSSHLSSSTSGIIGFFFLDSLDLAKKMCVSLIIYVMICNAVNLA